MPDTQNKEANFIQAAKVIWLTGVSGVGKTTVAENLKRELGVLGRNAVILDGDILRNGLNSDLGFSPEDRSESSRRASCLAKLLVMYGHWVIVSMISPYCKDRDFARKTLCYSDFIEVYLHAPLSVLMARDPKGLYQKVKAGKLSGFTGVDAPYEVPVCPELEFDTSVFEVEEIVCNICGFMRERFGGTFRFEPSVSKVYS